MEPAAVAKSVIKVIDNLIDTSKDDFKLTKSYKVRYGEGAEKFYLDKVDGTYESSLWLLIHKILFSEGLYQQFLDPDHAAEVEKVIKEEPDCIYKPDWDDDDAEEIWYETLDVIYKKVMNSVAKKLRTIPLR